MAYTLASMAKAVSQKLANESNPNSPFDYYEGSIGEVPGKPGVFTFTPPLVPGEPDSYDNTEIETATGVVTRIASWDNALGEATFLSTVTSSTCVLRDFTGRGWSLAVVEQMLRRAHGRAIGFCFENAQVTSVVTVDKTIDTTFPYVWALWRIGEDYPQPEEIDHRTWRVLPDNKLYAPNVHVEDTILIEGYRQLRDDLSGDNDLHAEYMISLAAEMLVIARTDSAHLYAVQGGMRRRSARLARTRFNSATKKVLRE